MTTELRVGILGTGFMGSMHARNANSLDGVRVSAICDVNIEGAQKLKQSLADASIQTFDRFESMLGAVELDVLYVCVPPFAHNGQVEAAAARGIHLFLEKPIALDLDRAASMVDAVEAAGVVSHVGYHMRYRQAVKRMQALLAGGEAGRVTQFQARYWVNMDGSPWWRAKDQSGGQIVEQLIHLYDLSMCLLGEPVSVSGYVADLCHQDRDDYTIEDTSAGTIRFGNGSVAVISGSNCALPMHFIGDFRLVCERMLLDYRCTGQPWVTPDVATITRHEGDEVEVEEITETTDPYLGETEHFIACVRAGRQTDVPARQGLESLRLVHAVVESSDRHGVPVAIQGGTRE